MDAGLPRSYQRRRYHRAARRLATLAGAGLLVVTNAAACASDGAGAGCAPSSHPDANPNTLVVEGDPWSGYAPFRDPTLLTDNAYELQYVEQLCQDMRAEDLTAGRADFIVTTLDQYLLQQPEGTVVGVIDQSLGADALVLNTRQHDYLDSIDDLRRLVDQYASNGEKPVLAYTGSSASEMLLNELANTVEEFRPTDFDLRAVDQSASALDLLQRDEAQLAILWEPDISDARDAGFTVTLSSRDVPDSIVDVIVANDQLLEQRRHVIELVVRSFYARMDHYLGQEDLQDLEVAIAEDGGLFANGDPDRVAARQIIDGIQLYGTTTASAFMNAPEFPLDEPQVVQSLYAIGSVLGLIHPEIDVDGARVDGSFVQAYAAELEGAQP